jgi:carbamoyl-phosphate synthase small subunit
MELLTKYKEKKRKLVLVDGTVFEGVAFGADRSISGEVVFNTGMTGYVETLTDPSYRGQILVLTYPLIGNYGVPSKEKEFGMLKNFESDKVHISGLIVCNYSQNYSHFNAVKSLHRWLKENNVPAISGIDTRELTKKLREHGVMPGKIIDNPEALVSEDSQGTTPVKEVSTQRKIFYGNGKTKIILIDCGAKNNIIRCFLKRNAAVIKVPSDYNFLNEEFDGVCISNGPGDPKKCTKTVEIVRELTKRNKPVFGICLGNQILALASGADTYKLKYGHRGQNQPCVEAGTKKCFITSQNHGYAVDEKSLPEDWLPWFKNLNDNTNEGIRHKFKPFFSVQFHPESNPGPTDTEFLFDYFINEVKNHGK